MRLENLWRVAPWGTPGGGTQQIVISGDTREGGHIGPPLRPMLRLGTLLQGNSLQEVCVFENYR